jgi:uncharacterized protein YyaL (SSP411 family)
MNALANETSPYLLQHAGNPVDWYPWGAEALELARRLDKPILLSIGYSACHWCHVMAHESFEDKQTAKLMNELFVNIKVDREERPDLDKIYQTAQHMLTRRQGGWPLTMFLAPGDQTPFFGGTYFPREPRYGLPGFRDLLPQIAGVYRTRSTDISAQNTALREALLAIQSLPVAAPGALHAGPLETARRDAEASFDARFGGFGGAPKFPHPTGLERLLRDHAGAESGDDGARRMALYSLECMTRGGLFDQIGGGFFRYSVDERWSIPHFEKMLYDNGPLLKLCAEAWQVSGAPLFRAAAIETADWALREMRAPDGGFYSSLDADSEGHEGKFYVWTPAEVETVLDADEYALLAPCLGLVGKPNFEGRWHFYLAAEPEHVVQRPGIDIEAPRLKFDAARSKLLAARERRVRPGRDEKILVSWNALMIKGLAAAGRILERGDYVQAAGRALDFIRGAMWRGGRLLATCKDGRAHLNAYVDDYAFLIDAILALLECRWRDTDLAFAEQLAQVLLEHFEDTEAGGFFFTSHDHEKLIQRTRSFSDDALPAGNGIAAFALQRLGHLLGETRYLDAAERTLRAAWASIERAPTAHNAMLLALEEYVAGTEVVVIRGDGADAAAWQQRAAACYTPRRLCVSIPADAPHLSGLLAQRRFLGGATAYICRGHQCDAPTTDFEQFDRLLGGSELRG